MEEKRCVYVCVCACACVYGEVVGGVNESVCTRLEFSISSSIKMRGTERSCLILLMWRPGLIGIFTR